MIEEEELTPQAWVERRHDWLVDVGVVRNGHGTFDVVARVDGSYAKREDAERLAGLSREQIHGMVRRVRRERGWGQEPPLDPPWPWGAVDAA